MIRAEIVTIGTELTLGIIDNTNATWLARRLTFLGCYVARIIAVRDNLQEIASAIKEALRRGADIVVTTGGLGPTDDDITLKSIAEALELKLVPNEEALAFIENRYRELHKRGLVKHIRLTPERLKMAMLPEGSKPIFNPIGTAPGAIIWFRKTAIICLPGVPQEMKEMFKSYVEPFIVKITGRVHSKLVKIWTNCNNELSLSMVTRRVLKRFPEVYIKPLVSHSGRRNALPITILVRGTSIDGLYSKLRQLVSTLAEELKRMGYEIIELEEGEDCAPSAPG